MVKKGDILDGMLFYANKANELSMPSQVYEYPEDVLQTLILFQKLWMLPANAIPSKQLRGRFAQWLKELQELNSLVKNNQEMQEILPIVFSEYEKLSKRFIVSHPLAIKQFMIGIMSEINRNKTKEKHILQETEELEITQDASKENVKSTIKDLKSIFEDED